MTTFVFEVKNVPAALYKALGGFATNGVNMTKLESYQQGASFAATMFYADIVGAPGDPAIDRALEELAFHTKELRMFGTYADGARAGLALKLPPQAIAVDDADLTREDVLGLLAKHLGLKCTSGPRQARSTPCPPSKLRAPGVIVLAARHGASWPRSGRSS